MIYIYCCRCHNAEPLARKIMRQNHFKEWQTYPMVKGRAECMAALGKFPDNEAISGIKDFLKRNSSWTIFLGVKGDDYRWVDVGHGGTKNGIDAGVILEDYNG